MTDITELAQRARINAECGEHLSPAETLELVEALESEKRICATWRKKAGEGADHQRSSRKAGSLQRSLSQRAELPSTGCTVWRETPGPAAVGA